MEFIILNYTLKTTEPLCSLMCFTSTQKGGELLIAEKEANMQIADEKKV